MFRIFRIHDDVLPASQDAIRQVHDMAVAQFGVEPGDIAQRLRNPFPQRFRTILLVADNGRGRVQGFALLLHEPQIHFCFLDYLASATSLTGRGVGGALYDRVRKESQALEACGLFYECLPDDAAACPEPHAAQRNARRIRFYERFGSRVIADTAYETPVGPLDVCPPHLMYDPLDGDRPLGRQFARKVVRAILERKYAELCSPEYVERVVASFRDDPVHLRPRHQAAEALAQQPARERGQPIALVVNDRHEIHHVRERGYVESPIRIKSILDAILPTGLFEVIEPRHYADRHVKAVHTAEYVDYLRAACAQVPAGKSVYPYVFPVRNAARPPKDLALRAGYYCIDTFTPLNRNAYVAAARGVDCTLTAADEILRGRRWAYSLVRPPGHHAERQAFGGFCYFNNAAVAAHYLSRFGKVAIVDVDYHHGNGQQEIFYDRGDVFTTSIHGHPSFAYPYFSGFADEQGAGAGQGFNLNIPLPEKLADAQAYTSALERALAAVSRFEPKFLIVALGFDVARGDPTGTWPLTPKDFAANGRLLADMDLPTLFVQEGGYRTRTLGGNAQRFFDGFASRGRKR